MKKIILVIFIILLSLSEIFAASDYTIELARSFGKDIFELNGIPYLQPMVETVNATSNSGFFNTAYVPHKVEHPYVKISVSGMLGFVRSDMKNYKPQMPNKELNFDTLSKYVDIDLIHQKFLIKDTAGLIHYAFLVYARRGLEKGDFKVPPSAPTVLGHDHVYFYLPRDSMKNIVKTYPPLGNKSLYDYLPAAMQDTLMSVISQFPEVFTLAEGGDINTIFAGVPQIEIGSFMGTELLLRFIPQVNMGTNIGDFAFWGVGLKHSISQYFGDKPPFDMAVQAVYQGTHLKNEVGVTKAQLAADATFWDVNIEFSKRFEKIIDVYAGFSAEFLKIKSNYLYYIPVEQQWQLGLLEKPYTTPTPGYPGDTDPQTASLQLKDKNFKFVIGLAREIGPVTIFANYNISKFNVIAGGLSVKLWGEKEKTPEENQELGK